MSQRVKRLKLRDVKDATTLVAGVKLELLRPLPGTDIAAGDVTTLAKGWPIGKVVQMLRRGHVVATPTVNFRRLSKREMSWCAQRGVAPPQTLGDLEKLQGEIGEREPSYQPQNHHAVPPTKDDIQRHGFDPEVASLVARIERNKQVEGVEPYGNRPADGYTPHPILMEEIKRLEDKGLLTEAVKKRIRDFMVPEDDREEEEEGDAGGDDGEDGGDGPISDPPKPGGDAPPVLTLDVGGQKEPVTESHLDFLRDHRGYKVDDPSGVMEYLTTLPVDQVKEFFAKHAEWVTAGKPAKHSDPPLPPPVPENEEKKSRSRRGH